MFRKQEKEFQKEKFKKINRNLWGIILAGGEGNRLKDFVIKLYGYYKPKQYCKIADSKSLIKRTLDRALTIIPKDRLITIINKTHLKFAEEEIGDQPVDTIVIQPSNKETCAGLLLPLLKVNRQDPSSIVAILPSDHFIFPEDKFMEYIQQARKVVERYPNKIVTLGVVPDRIDSGYGWIERGRAMDRNNKKNIYTVSKFWEKPSNEKAEALFADGCYLNTFVLVGTTHAFINYIQLYAPEIYNSFEKIRLNNDKSIESLLLEEIYSKIPSINFSSFVLEKIPHNLLVMEVPDVYWSDWGEEQRIMFDNERFGLSAIKSKQYEEVIKQNVIAFNKKLIQIDQEIICAAK